MLRSIFSGITGLRAHQQMMDVTGNNIANVNTTGYKTQNAVFQSVMAQTMKAPGAPIAEGAGTNSQGGVNGVQIGLGVDLGAVTTNFRQGSAQMTGVSTDFMIDGEGFFVTDSGTERLFTRAGAFTTDANGSLVTPDGYVVQGWMADAEGEIDINAVVEDVILPVSSYLPPVESTTLTVDGNLPAGAAVNDTVTGSITVYNDLGTARTVTATMTKTAANTWTINIGGGASATNIVFNAAGVAAPLVAGELNAATLAASPIAGTDATGEAFTIDITGLTQYASPSSFAVTDQNGSGVGTLTTFTTTSDGRLIGVYSNGVKQPIAQLAVAVFNNSNALESIGDTMYRDSVNSGVPLIGAATFDGRGSLRGGSLEMSNVDLASEFTNLIMAQRGFAANSRTLTASDEMLQELMNIKR